MEPAIPTGGFIASDGVKLHNRRWEVDAPKASVLIVHGYAEHCERYDHVARFLNDAGFSVYGYDHRGHGQSDGQLGYVPSFDRLIDDLHEFSEALWNEDGHPQTRFIFGHSMGGLVTARYVIQYQPSIRGIVFSGSAVSLGKVPLHLRLLSPILSVVAPKLPATKLAADSISRIPEEVEKYLSDPKVYTGPIMARTGHEMMRAAGRAQEGLYRITLPFLAVHGAADRLVSPRASEILYEGAQSEDRTLKLYEGAYHEVHNDLPREEFLRDITDWMLDRA